MAQLHMHKCNIMAALGYVNTLEHKLRTHYSVVPIGFSPALDPSPSCPYVSPRTQLGSVGTLYCVVGAHKTSV